MMFHYRAEYPGRSGLAKRAERLNIYMYSHDLLEEQLSPILAHISSN
jgi:hypothetical protein